MGNSIKLFVFIFAFALLSMNGMGQSKPQRDVAKDRKTAVKKTQASSLPKVKTQVVVSNKPKRTVVKRHLAYSNKRKTTYKRSRYIKNEEPFLTVSTTNLMFDAQGSTKSVDVRTNGKSWYLDGVPDWCEVSTYRDFNFFSIKCLENESEKPKNASFLVHSGNKTSRIYVYQSGAPAVQAFIHNVTLQHNIKVGNEKYLVISGTVDISVPYERSFFIGALFYDTQYRFVNVSLAYPSYKLPDCDYLFLSASFVAKKSQRNYYFSMYLPNNAMLLGVSRSKELLMCRLNVFNSLDGAVISSNGSHECVVAFHVRSRKKNIITSE